MTSAPARLNNPDAAELRVRDLGHREYARVWQDMRDFTASRDGSTVDELWLVEHPPVYTLGTNDRKEDFTNPGIPVIQSDRGGQITYHGPGQLIAYVLLDLRRRSWGVRQLVRQLETSVICLLAQRGLVAELHPGAPGVYVDGKKIAQLGLRVRRGACYHGLSLNINMDHTPFRCIKPCGYAGLQTTDLAILSGDRHLHPDALKGELVAHLAHNLGYNSGTAIRPR